MRLSDTLRRCPLRPVVVAIVLPLNRLRTRAARRTQEDIVSRGADRAERAARVPAVIISHCALLISAMLFSLVSKPLSYLYIYCLDDT